MMKPAFRKLCLTALLTLAVQFAFGAPAAPQPNASGVQKPHAASAASAAPQVPRF
jgi:hypothetical protein